MRMFFAALVMVMAGIFISPAQAESIFCQRIKPCIGANSAYESCTVGRGFVNRDVIGQGWECQRNPNHVPRHYILWEKEQRAKQVKQGRR